MIEIISLDSSFCFAQVKMRWLRPVSESTRAAGSTCKRTATDFDAEGGGSVNEISMCGDSVDVDSTTRRCLRWILSYET